MLVKHLIDELKKYNQDMEVLIEIPAVHINMDVFCKYDYPIDSIDIEEYLILGSQGRKTLT